MAANISYDNAPTNKSMQVTRVIPTIHSNRTYAYVVTNTPHFIDIEGDKDMDLHISSNQVVQSHTNSPGPIMMLSPILPLAAEVKVHPDPLGIIW